MNFPAPIFMPASADTPRIQFVAQTMRLEIEGKSLPTSTFEFYKPLFEWLDEHLHCLEAPLTVQFNFSYFNTTSSKVILIILDKISEAIKEKQKNITAEWCYKTDDMENAGLDYQDISQMQFIFCSGGWG